MSEADVILDWLWSDIPMAVVGTEAGSLGKASIIASYGWEQWDRWQFKYGKDFIPPVIRASPENLYENLINVFDNRKIITEIGNDSKNFIKDKWQPSEVAKNYMKVISDETPPEWFVSPMEIDYLWGAGVSRVDTLQMVDALIRSGKKNALRWPRGEQMYRKILIETDSGNRY